MKKTLIFLFSIAGLCFGIFLIINALFINNAKDTFNWQMEKNKTIKVYLNQHPYAEAIIKSIPEFERLTGINVEYFVSDENVFQKKVFYFLRNKPSEVDVFMTGPYYIWRNAYDGLIADLSVFLNNPAYVSKEYNFQDFHPKIIDGLKYDFDGMHENSIWAMPSGFEITSIIYNKRLFNELKIAPPNDFNELLSIIKKIKKYDSKIIPIGIRGLNSWTSISSNYINLYYNYGLVDFLKSNDSLVPNVNSARAVKFNELWLKIIKEYGDPALNKVSWYELGANLGSGKYAMIFDADFIGYNQNISNISKESGNIDIHKIMDFYNKQAISNLWVWGLGINNASDKKLASWLFIQYCTSSKYYSNIINKYPYLSPPRVSMLKSQAFTDRTSQKYKNYLISGLNNSKVLMTPQPYVIEIMDKWMQELYNIRDGKYSTVKEGLDVLNKEIEDIVKDVRKKR